MAAPGPTPSLTPGPDEGGPAPKPSAPTVDEKHKGSGTRPVPKVPFCRAGADVANMWLPVWDPDNQVMEKAKRVVVFGGKGVDYYTATADSPLAYLSDMWALHITNTGFRWTNVAPRGKLQPSPRWQTGDAVAFERSMVIFGGDDQTTNGVGGLGDLWVYSPRGSSSRLQPQDAWQEDEWKSYERGGQHPGERREPSLTMVNATLVLQGGRVVDGDSDEECDSRLFLVDLADPEGIWREGPSLPGLCGLGQTMDTVRFRLPEDDESKTRAVVFGGCQWGQDKVFSCSNDLYAYDLGGDHWVLINPKSDADAHACKSNNFTPAAPSTNISAGSTGTDGEYDSEEAECPGITTPRPLGRHAHASAYIESKEDDVHALFIFGGRENADDLTPLGDLWMFDFKKMRWSEITPDSNNSPVNRFSHSLTVWQGGAGDGVASLVVFGGETITRTGQTAYLNDVWLYTPFTGKWREVSRPDCLEGASGIARGGEWTALLALVILLSLVVIVQCLLHNICPHYEPPPKRRRRRRRSDGGVSTRPSKPNGAGAAEVAGDAEDGSVRREKSTPSLTDGLLSSKSSQPSYQALQE